MRIVFVTNPHYPDGLASLRVLVESGHEVVAVVTPTERRRRKGFAGTVRAMIDQYGLRGFLEKAIHAVWVVARTRLSRGQETVESYARKRALPLHVPRRLGGKDFFPTLKALAPDLIVVSYCSQIFPKKVIQLPTIGCLNVHRSLLPKYRGPQPIFWALYHDEKETGATVHWLVQDIDAGDILAQERVPIHDWDAETDVASRAAEAGARALAAVLPRIAAGERWGTTPDLSAGSYYSRPDVAQLATYRERMAERAARRRTRSRQPT